MEFKLSNNKAIVKIKKNEAKELLSNKSLSCTVPLFNDHSINLMLIKSDDTKDISFNQERDSYTLSLNTEALKNLIHNPSKEGFVIKKNDFEYGVQIDIRK